MAHGLGRKPNPPDPRDYKMADYVKKLKALQLADRTWNSGKVLDQMDTGHCVAFSWCGWGICEPVIMDYSNDDAHTIYYECKIIDGEPGEENGSYVRSGAQAMQDRGRLGTYYFAYSIPEAADYVKQYGPVILGIDWYSGMFYPDSTGLIKPTGNIAGGHAILWRGVQDGYAYLRNSWGTGWGKGGDCRISLTDLTSVFENLGDACAASELPLTLNRKFKVNITTRRI